MSPNLAVVIIAALALIVALCVPFLERVWEYLRWRKLPQLHDYVAKHPQCQTTRGIRCAYCSGGSIKNWGLTRTRDQERVFVCNHCGAHLYRSD